MRRSLFGTVLVCILFGGAAAAGAWGAAPVQTGNLLSATIGSAPGLARYQATDQSYVLAARGSAVQGEADNLCFAWQPLDGDSVAMAQVSLTVASEPGAGGEAGVMIRESEEAGSPLVAVLASEKGVVFARRTAAGQSMRRAGSPAFTAPISVRLIRSGNQFSAWIAETADPSAESNWKRLGEPQTVEMKRRVLVGLVAAGQGPNATARLAKVSVGANVPAGTGVRAGATAKGLIHQYSFRDGTANDSVGTAHGQLIGRAQASGGKLVLDNAGRRSNDPSTSYAQFPTSILPGSGSVSIELWFTSRTADMWARVLDMGNQQAGNGDRYLFVTPRGEGGTARMAYALGGPGRESQIITRSPLDDGRPHMIAIVFDGNNGTLSLYVDGSSAGTPVNVGRDAMAKLAPEKVWLGRSMFDGDTAFSGTVEHFRIYQTLLTPDEIADHYRNPSR